MTADDITGIHHIGLVVRDLDAAIATFTRLGFHIGPPAYPALPPQPGAAPEPVGAGNTHADFRRGFIELLALAPANADRLPAESALVPLRLPDDQLEATRAAIGRTVAGLAGRLERFEGAHILVFASADAERTAVRLDAAGVGHTGARAAQRPVTTAEGTRLEAIEYLDIHGESPAPMPAEGRVGAAEDALPEVLDAQIGLDHPNGARALAECVLSVGDLDATAGRYERYLGIAARGDGRTLYFDLPSGRLTVTTDAGFGALLAGERPPAVPALGAYAVEVADPAAAERHLREQGVEVRTTSEGEPFIPAAAAHGAAVVLRAAGS